MSSEQRNIFGTDGVRDVCASGFDGKGWLAPAGLDRLAQGMVRFLERARRDGRITADPPRVLIGRDPRLSGPAIERVLTTSLERHGIVVRHGGILPTPAVSVLVEEGEAELGIVISASHNPPEFNGVKWFGPDGAKLTVEEEERVSADVLAAKPHPALVPLDPNPSAGATDDEAAALRARYLDRLLVHFGGSSTPEGSEVSRPLAGMRIVLDCARGATAICAVEAYERAGAEVHAIHATPDGERINLGCGSTHPEAISGAVLARGADLGIAFDGDGDRAILVDETGAVVDGDEMLTLWALDLHRRGALPHDKIAVTVMSNAGMESYLGEQGISLVRTPVGDREVHQAMLREGLVLGGEQSGHIIRAGSATGDGIRTGLSLASLVRRSGKPLSELRSAIPRYPQTLLGVTVRRKPALSTLPEVATIVSDAERALAGHGRVLLRYSGTEPLARVLVEGADAEENDLWAERIADVLRDHPSLHEAITSES